LKSLHSIHGALPAPSLKKLTDGKSVSRRSKRVDEDDDGQPKMSQKLI
jgi:hypothetical protein